MTRSQETYLIITFRGGGEQYFFEKYSPQSSLRRLGVFYLSIHCHSCEGRNPWFDRLTMHPELVKGLDFLYPTLFHSYGVAKDSIKCGMTEKIL